MKIKIQESLHIDHLSEPGAGRIDKPLAKMAANFSYPLSYPLY
jgi:hypothetical protein